MKSESPPDDQLNLAQVTLKGAFWAYLARYSGKFIVFISTIILARLLDKADFGLVGYALVLTNFLDMLNDMGVGSALVYYAEDEEASSSAFWMITGFGFLLLVITWLAAPLVGIFFQDERAVLITRIMGITFPIDALGKVHTNLLSKNLAWRKGFFPSFSRLAIKGIFSVILALLGYGAWSLVWGNILGSITYVIVAWVVMPWRPTLLFNRKIAKDLSSYGLNVSVINVLSYFLRDSDYLFVGRFLGSAALGVYTLAFRLPDLMIYQFINVISKITFPIYVKLNENVEKLKHSYLEMTKYIAFFSVPLGLGLILVARPLILVFYTATWAEAIPVVQAISAYALVSTLGRNSGSIFRSIGRPDVLTKMAILRAFILLPAMYWAVTQIGTIASVGWIHAVIAFFASLLNLWMVDRIVKISIWDSIKVMLPAFWSGALMALGVWAILDLVGPLAPILQLVSAVMGGGFIYLTLLSWQDRTLIQKARKIITVRLQQ
jgi:O-antigen/teichoic acid export membrane protein